MKTFQLLCLALLVPFFLQGQQVYGTIQDATSQPMVYANVLLFDAEDSSFVRGSISDDEGYFEFLQLAKGSYYLNASMLGFENYYSSSFQVEEPQFFNIILKSSAALLDEMEVTASKPLFEQQIDRMIVNVENSITAAGSTVLEVLERSPGIQVDRMNGRIEMQGKQGVVVMLNGKRMRLDAQSLVQLLQSTPADNIEKIELISAPPASFDAEGDAGIINIQTKINKDQGLHLNGNLNGAYGLRGKYGSSVNWNYRRQQWNLYGDFTTTQNYTQEDASISRININGNQVTASDMLSRRPAYTGLYNGRIGLDLELSDKITIGGLFSAYYRHWVLDANTQTQIQDNMQGPASAQLITNEINDGSHWMTNLNLSYQISEQTNLSMNYDHLYYEDDNPVNYFERFYDGEGTLLSSQDFLSRKTTPIVFDVAKIDLHHQWESGLSMEMGLKATLSDFRNDVGVERLVAGDWVIDPLFTDLYTMNEKIGAAYTSFDYRLNSNLNAKAGLRYEYYDSKLGSAGEGDLIVQEFGRLFPTFFLSYQISEEKQFQLSYNERITRPAFNDIAPAFFFWDSNTILAGNPTVRPTISRKLGASYRYKGALLSLNYTDDDNAIVFQPQANTEANQIITGAVNMPDRKTAMASLNMPIRITDTWESRYNLSFFWAKLFPVYEGIEFEQSARWLSINTTHNLRLPRNYQLELNANWTSSIRFGLGELKPRGMINLGVQKALNDQLKLSLNWNDLFDLGSFWKVRFEQEGTPVDYDWFYQMEGNVIRLNLSWQLGNTKLKGSRKRDTGSEEERGRLGS